jgi:hypothetical protein
MVIVALKFFPFSLSSGQARVKNAEILKQTERVGLLDLTWKNNTV